VEVPVRKWMTSAVLAAAVLVGSAETLWAQATPAAPAPAPGAQAAPASPPIVVYRKALMNQNTQHMAALRALTAAGGIGLAEAETRSQIQRHAAALWENANLMTKGVRGNWDVFPANSLHATSRATPKIWVEQEGGTGVEFAWRIQAFEQTTNALLQLAKTESSSVDQIREAVQRVQVTCGGCHASMRGPAPAATN
jgi:cytochrome c556